MIQWHVNGSSSCRTQLNYPIQKLNFMAIPKYTDPAVKTDTDNATDHVEALQKKDQPARPKNKNTKADDNVKDKEAIKMIHITEDADDNAG